MSETVGLIAAMAMESAALARLLAPWSSLPLPGFRAHRYFLRGVEYILVESGMGMEKAAAATRALISAAAPRSLLSFGICGSLEEDARIGDVIVASSVLLFEGGSVEGGIPLEPLFEPALQAVRRALEARGVRIWKGTAVTTRGPQPAPRQLADLEHPFLDMETHGIARVAGEHGIPLTVIRSVSDTPREPIPIAIEDLIDGQGHFRLASLITAVARRPSLLPRLIRSGGNSRAAAENAAAAVAAVLESPT
jgi:adenosylhomocysteine nucleosidase